MMTAEEVLDLPGHEPPVVLKDGCVGLLVGYPFQDREECLVQVHGEVSERRIHPKHLTKVGATGLAEDGATFPDDPERFDQWASTRLLLQAAEVGA